MSGQPRVRAARGHVSRRRRPQDAVIEGIQRVFREALACETDEELGRRCLAVAEELTDSRIGFIGELGPTGQVDDLAVSDPGWEACRIPAASLRKTLTGLPIRGLYGRVLASGKPFFTNEPSRHPDSHGLPPGHPPITSFLGVPLLQDGKTIGMLAVANREGGYGEADVHALTALAPAVVQTLLRRRGEQRLRDSETRLRTLGDNLPEGAMYRFVSPKRGGPRFEYISAGVADICGVPPVDVLRDPATLFQIVDSDDLARLAREERRCAEALEPLETEVRHRHRDSGELRWTALRAVPRELSDGQVVWDGLMFDVTERKRGEAFTAALNAIHQVIHSTRDFDAIMRSALSEAVRATGGCSGAVSLREGGHWVVTHVTGVPDEAVGSVTGDDEEPHAVLAIRTRTPVAVADVERDERVNREHMRRLGVRAVLVIPLIVRDEPVGVLFLNQRAPTPFGRVHLDFAMKLGSALVLALENARLIAELERELVERRAREHRIAVLARLYAVLSRVNEAIVRERDELGLFADVCRIVAEEGGFPLVWIGLVRDGEVAPVAASGPAKGYLDGIGIRVEGPRGAGPTGTAVREGHAVVNQDFASNPATAPWRERALEYRFRSSAAFPLRRHGDLVGALTLYAADPRAFDPEQVALLGALSADLSYALGALADERLRSETEAALRASEQSLREADRRKNDFLAVLSHELRNPLAPIMNGVQVLARVPPGSDQAQRALAVLDRQVRQLTSLVDDLLDVTRITRNKIQLERERVDLRDVVRRTVEDNRSLFEKSEVRLGVDVGPAPVPVDADPTRVAQIVGNLLHNAAKFTGRGGETRVSVRIEGDDAVIAVVDTGVGMTPETVARLFQPFVQADATLDRSKGGLGLGLAFVKGLVELHGGHIAAHSAGLGKGSELFVRLPLDRGATPDRATRPAVLHSPPRRVLIVEDNVDAAESLREALQLCGHDVAVAHDGPGGIAAVRSLKPEVVLCDIGLPGMDGYAVARAIRADDTLRGMRLVALSGYALAEDLRRATAAGFDRHLAKPPSLEELDEVLATAAG